MLRVFILTRHTGNEPLFGAASCVYNSIRKGFPTAEIHTYDNASVAESQLGIIRRAHNVGTFFGYVTEVGHWDYIETIIDTNDDPVVFVDPDVIFYENVEMELETIKELVAGRFCPAFFNPVVNCNEVERIHTSLLYVRDPQELRERVKEKESPANYPASSYQGFFSYHKGRKMFHDTFANVYHQLHSQEIHLFSAAFLDKYTHLVSGSMLNRVSSVIGNRLAFLHEHAEKSPDYVRNLWREQEEFYKFYPVR